MRNIIVAVDFEKSSITSFLHALSIAEKTGAKITLLWVNKSSSTSNSINANYNQQEELAINHFKELIRKYQYRLINNTIEYKIRHGKVYTEIVDEAVDSKADLVIVGAHGSSGYERFFIGSNASKVIASSPCPTLTFRDTVDEARSLKKIVFPLDHTIESRQKILIAMELAKIFKAEISIIGLFTSNVKNDHFRIDGYIKQVTEELDHHEIKYTVERRECENPTKETIKYGEEIKANLVVIMSEQVTSTKNLWLGSYAQQMINTSPFPVLTVRWKQVYDYQAK